MEKSKGGNKSRKENSNAVQLQTLSNETKGEAQSEENSSRLRRLAYLNLGEVQGRTNGEKNYFSWATAKICKPKQFTSLADYVELGV